MKKYRLIREYPGSPKLGAIIELKRNGGYELENSTSYFMTKDKVENYPEFWEEIVEKDYEILSIQCILFDNYILTKGSNGKFKNEYKEIDFNLNYYKIHSVKRLSDGEVFTLGDKINNSTIINIIIKKDKIYLEI